MQFRTYVPFAVIHDFMQDLEDISNVLKDLPQDEPVIIHSIHKLGFPVVDVYMPDDHPVGILLRGPRSPMWEKGWELQISH